MTASYFTHLRTIRFAEDRLRLLRAAREAYSRAMSTSTLAQANTDRVDGSAPCLPLIPRRARNS